MKDVLPLKYKISKYIFIISIAVKIILLILGAAFNLYLVGIHTPYVINFVILISALLYISKIKDRRILKLIMVSILILLILINSFITYFLFDNEEYIFNSPNKKNAIIVDENTFILSTNYNFYEEKYGIFKKDLHKSISADIRFFNDNQYWIEWQSENVANIRYAFRSGSMYTKDITITLK